MTKNVNREHQTFYDSSFTVTRTIIDFPTETLTGLRQVRLEVRLRLSFKISTD